MHLSGNLDSSPRQGNICPHCWLKGKQRQVRGWDFYNQIRAQTSHPEIQLLFWHCFLLFFMIICIHQFCIDLAGGERQKETRLYAKAAKG